MRERILAIVGAVALVAVAVALRAQLADDDTTGAERGGGGRPVVACTPDLMAVCDALVADGRIADDPPELDLGPDAAAARVGDRRIDGWVTWDPAPGIANIDADEAGAERPPWEGSEVLGGSSTGVAVRDGTAFEGCSPTDLTWSCIADAARAARPVAVGVGTGLTAESLARLYPIAATLVPDGGDATQIPAADLRAVLDSPAVDQTDARRQLDLLRTAPGTFQVVVAPSAAIGDPRAPISRSAPTPGAEVVVVVAWRTGGSGEDLADRFGSDRVAAALRDVGVEPGAGTLAPERRAGELFQVRAKVG